MIRTVAKALLNRFGVEAVRAATFSNFLHTRPIDLVVDIGANLGQFAESVRARGYRGRMISVEPLPDIHACLPRARVAQPWTTVCTAIGDTTGRVDIHAPPNHSLASIKSISQAGAAMIGAETAGTRVVTVDLTTVDRLLADDPAQHIFLKVDTQGYERQVLDGARATLPRCEGLLLELPIEHLYDDVWSFNEALAYIDDLGFVPAQFRTVCAMNDDPASAFELDCLFRPKLAARP